MATTESRSARIARLTAEAVASTKATPAKPQVKTAAKPTVTAEPVVEDTEFSTDEFMAALKSRFGNFKIPSGRRMLASIVAQCILGFGIGYVGGLLISYALVGAALLTGSVLIQWMVWVLGVALVIYTSYKACLRLGRYIALGEIDHDFARARNWLRGLRGNKEMAHA